MIPRKAVYALALAVLLARPPGVGAAVRVAAPDVGPFFLAETAVEDSTPWYDAQTWLGHFPGTIEWDASSERLTYREGEHWAALRPEAPFALRDGRVLQGAGEARIQAGRLLLNEAFLVSLGGEFLGRTLKVERAPQGPVRRVALDPGHGGADPGTRGPGRLAEKDVVLGIARVVADRLRAQGIEVHLTRSDDQTLNDDQRAAVSNYWGADLFLSLHAAGLGRPQARGVEVFVAPAPPPGTDPRLWSSGQMGLGAESRRWAQLIRESLGEALPTFDRGLAAVPQPVLAAVAAPACLVELGSLGWPQEAEFLQGAVGREAIGDAVARAVGGYFR